MKLRVQAGEINVAVVAILGAGPHLVYYPYTCVGAWRVQYGWLAARYLGLQMSLTCGLGEAVALESRWIE